VNARHRTSDHEYCTLHFSMRLRPPSSTLFPYTTLFRSRDVLDTLPGMNDVWGPAKLVPGVQMNKYDVGGTEGFQQATIRKPSVRSEEHTSELQSRSDLVCRLLLEKKNEISQHILQMRKA